MNQLELARRVRAMTRDFSESIFREQDIFDFMNEGIERISQIIKEMRDMPILLDRLQVVTLLPNNYQHLIILYGASRCFTQDERHFQASNLMNEFEIKLSEMKADIENGELIIVDSVGVPVIAEYKQRHVVDNYFANRNGVIDIDNGVEGLE